MVENFAILLSVHSPEVPKNISWDIQQIMTGPVFEEKKKKTCIQNNFVFKPCNHSSYSFVKPWLGTLEDLYVIMPCTALWGTARACTLGINLPTFWIPGSGCVVWACFVCLTSINTLGAARSCSLVFQHIHYSQFLHIPTPSQKGVRQNFISTVMTMTPDKLLQNQTSRLFYF